MAEKCVDADQQPCEEGTRSIKSADGGQVATISILEVDKMGSNGGDSGYQVKPFQRPEHKIPTIELHHQVRICCGAM